MKINCSEILDDIVNYPDYFFNTVFCDSPYNLGSTWIIDKDTGKPVIKEARDFMDKWEGMTHEDWEQFFKEAYRVLKYGGYAVMFGIDRQFFPIQYYAKLAGFEICQSLYWYFIQNFPKATDAGKMIDKRLGKEREIVGQQYKNPPGTNLYGDYGNSYQINTTKASSPLAKTFDGYKYSVAPLKQTVETIMVFRKPTRNKSVLDDLLAWSEGDKEISPSVLNIDGGRVPTNEETKREKGGWQSYGYVGGILKKNYGIENQSDRDAGRYPAQTFLDGNTAEVIDRQSGNRKGWSGQNHNGFNPYGGNALNKSATEREGKFEGFRDSGGASRICHICTYEQDEIDLFFYCPKVSDKERNAGLGKFNEKEGNRTTGKHLSNYIRRCPKHGKPIPSGGSTYTCGCEFQYDNNIIVKLVKNNHSTLKPIAFNKHIMTLFKLPDEADQRVYVPFAGTFSEIIGARKAGIREENIYGCEIEQKWIDIGWARCEYFLN